MRLIVAALATGLLFPIAADGKDENECRKVKAQIRKLEARMRRPYTAAQGVRFDERMRELKEKRYRVCR